MIRDIETAKRAVELTQQANKLLIDSLEVVRSKCPTEEYEVYSRAMAQVTGHLFFLVMEPIYCTHLSLAPPDTPVDFVERWRRMGQQKNAE